MPLKWSEVSEKPEFQALPIEEKEAARWQYFEEIVKPQAQENEIDEIRSQFEADTRIEGYEPKPSEDQIKYFEDNKATNDELALHVFSRDEIDAIKSKGKIGFVEAFNYTKWEDAVPFIGMAKKGYDLIKLNNIAQKPQDQITEEERDEMAQYLRDQLELDLRGVEVGGNIAFGVWQAPAFMAEFAATMGAGKAVVSAGKAAIGYTAKKAVEKSILQMGKRALLKKGAEATGHALLATALNVPRITSSYNERMLNERTSVTDKGQAIFKEAETSPFTALAKTYGELAVENVSEVAGPAFGLVARPFAPIISKLAPYADNIPTYALSKLSPSARDAFVKTYRKTIGNAYVSKMFSKGGWNGAVAEFGEERVGDLMRFALDLDQKEGYSLDQLYDAAIPDKEQALAEAGVIGILGTSRRVGNYLVNKLQENSGMTKADAEEVVRGMTATEQDSLWETMTKEERRASLNNVEERAFKQFTESGIEEAESKAQAKNYRAMAKWGAERAGVSPEAFYENLKLTVKKEQVADNPTPENAKAYTKEILEKLKRDKAESAARKAERPVFDGDEIVLEPKQTTETQDVSTGGEKRELDTEGPTVSVGGEAVVQADETRYQLDYGTLWGRIVNLEGWLERKKDFTEGQVLSMERELRKAKKELKRMEVEGEALLQSAYHGSPYRFERFDLSKIGTGEGAQAYGWGQYFAERRGVAEQYRQDLSRTILAKIPVEVKSVLKKVDNLGFDSAREAMAELRKNVNWEKDFDLTGLTTEDIKILKNRIATDIRGQLYQVHIPDEDVARMIDWDKPLGEQSATIKEIAKSTKDMTGVKIQDLSKYDGGDLYRFLEEITGSQKAASEYLNSFGIVGIKYLDSQSRGAGEGTRNFVVFDKALLDKISDSIETLYQDMKSGAKGSITFKDTGEKIINLFANSDKSTFLHETGHIYLREMRRIAGMSQKATEEFEVIKKHLGSEDGEFTIAQEERFARNFEQYFMEGSAPNKELRGVFDSFKKWLFEIYKSVRSLNGTLNNEVRDVFDQMLGGKDLDIYSMDIPLDNTETMFDNLHRNMVNDLQPLENLVKKFEKLKGKLPDGLNPVMLARLGMRAKSQIIHNITKETYYIDENGNYVSTGEGLKPILDDFDFEMARVEPDHNTRYSDLEEYLVAQRYTKDLMTREGVKITPRQAEESITILARLTKKYGEEMIRFDDYAQRIYDFQARILQNLVRSGIKTQEWYDGIIQANPHYIPFHRVFDEGEIEEGFFIGGKTKYGATGEVIKELKGSERDVKNVFGSILKNTGRIIDASNRNIVAREVAAMGRVMPDYVQLTEESGPKTIRYYENGEIKKINVTEGLWHAMSNVHPAQHSVFTRLFAPIQFSATLLRAGATAMPDFWIRNFMRDQSVSRIQATAKMGQIDIVQGLMSSLGKDASYERWKAVGGGFDSYMDLSDKNIEEAYREIMSPKGKLARYLKTGGLAALQDASMVVEEGPRVAVFKAAKKAKMSDMAAALDSNDATVDFKRSGTIGRVLNRYIPFLNAGIQGIDKMLRAFKKNPALMSYRAFTTITVPQIIMTGYYLFAAPDDEREDYLEIPQWLKDIAFPIKIGDSWWYMPKPFALGYVFGSLPERFMLWSYNDGDPSGEDLWKEVMLGIGQSISPIQDIGAIMTPAGRIAVESITNYNFFTGRSVYPEWLEKLPPEEQSNKYTSETAKLIGENLGMSPALIDNAIRGQLGGVAGYGIHVTDSIIKAVKEWNGEEIPEKPTTNADIMFIRGFSIRRPSGYNAISTQRFLKKYGEFEQYRASYASKKGKEKSEYYERHGDKIRTAQSLKPIREQIHGISKRIDFVYEDKQMSSEEKVRTIGELEDQILEIARRGNETILEIVGGR